MNKESIQEFFETFRQNILEDGGDYMIVSVREDYVRLKIKGKRNRHRSRDNLYSLLKLALKQRFPGNKIVFEMEPWVVKDQGGILEKLLTFLGLQRK